MTQDLFAGDAVVVLVDFVDSVIKTDDFGGSDDVMISHGVKGFLQHISCFGYHNGKIEFVDLAFCNFGHARHALSDVDGHVSDAFDFSVDFEDGDDLAQVAGNGLVQSQNFQAFLLNGDFRLVDFAVLADDLLGNVKQMVDDGFNSEVNRVLDPGSLVGEHVLEVADSLDEMRLHVELASLTKAAGDVFFSFTIAGIGENLLGRTGFDDLAFVEEGRDVADAGSLLHIVGDDDNSEVLL